MPPQCQALGVDAQSSVLFGHPDGRRELRGMGMSVMPANLDHTAFDDVHWVFSGEPPTRSTRQLHAAARVVHGTVTSGASYRVADWYAKDAPEPLTVVMLPDEGHRYHDTVYDDDGLRGKDTWPSPRQRAGPGDRPAVPAPAGGQSLPAGPPRVRRDHDGPDDPRGRPMTGTGRLTGTLGPRTRRVVYGELTPADIEAELPLHLLVDRAHLVMLAACRS